VNNDDVFAPKENVDVYKQCNWSPPLTHSKLLF